MTLVAVLFGSPEHGNDIAVGAAMGGPLVVGTVAYGVTGAMLIWRKRRLRARPPPAYGAAGGAVDGASDGGVRGRADDGAADGGSLALATRTPGGDLAGVDTGRLARDQQWFLAIFAVKVGLGLVAFTIKPWLGWLFFAVYVLYFVREMRDDRRAGVRRGPGAAEAAAAPRAPARPSPSSAQTLITLVVIFGASQLFVQQLEWAGPALGLPSAVVALLLSPIATELPEIMNAIIWVRQGKLQLALANISGAMMIQATVPSGIGILLTSWRFDTPLVLAGAATMASVLYLLWVLRAGRLTAGRLAAAAGFYLAFAVGLVVAL